MTESRAIQHYDGPEYWAETPGPPVEIPEVVCPECNSASRLYKAGHEPITRRPWFWCYGCNTYFLERQEGDD